MNDQQQEPVLTPESPTASMVSPHGSGMQVEALHHAIAIINGAMHHMRKGRARKNATIAKDAIKRAINQNAALTENTEKQ